MNEVKIPSVTILPSHFKLILMGGMSLEIPVHEVVFFSECVRNPKVNRSTLFRNYGYVEIFRYFSSEVAI